MKYSVIMSIYNEPLKYIKSSIDSILSQTLKNFEFIIVIDNPDREDVYDILQTYLASDARVKVLSNERNMGLAYSLNKAIKYSVGNYIFRMDADDISYPERFEKQINFMEKYRLDFSATLIEVMDEDEETLYK
ncbi:glycosyltransferase family 2 protein, partial [Streptococcus agalactiae]|nr:glycosyltransferase family 2 protein [Streptococcus agalactiae]